MEYQYVAPVPRVHRVVISGHLKTYRDLWIEEDYDARLAPPVQEWLDANAPKTRVICDRGDWGEGVPIFYLDFISKEQVDRFMTEFAKPGEVDLEQRTARFYTSHYPDMLTTRNDVRMLSSDVTDWLRRADEEPVVNINQDDQGEFINIVFTTALARQQFVSMMWRQGFRNMEADQ